MSKSRKQLRHEKHLRHKAHPELTPHGTRAGYAEYGCRCDRCKRASSDYHRKRRARLGGLTSEQREKSRAYSNAWRARKRAEHAAHPERTPHGTRSGYGDYGCRCRECTDAMVQSVREWREKRQRNG